MTRFEYKIENIPLDNYGAEDLNRLGADGWEFVQQIEPVTTHRGTVTRCLFKRATVGEGNG